MTCLQVAVRRLETQRRDERPVLTIAFAAVLPLGTLVILISAACDTDTGRTDKAPAAVLHATAQLLTSGVGDLGSPRARYCRSYGANTEPVPK